MTDCCHCKAFFAEAIPLNNGKECSVVQNLVVITKAGCLILHTIVIIYKIYGYIKDFYIKNLLREII
jgi:hypothetical protein